MFLWLANWWDSADLWLTQLAFPFQFAIVIAVLAPLCFGAAWLIDRGVDLARRVHREVSTPPTEPVILVRADVPPGTPATIIRAEPQTRAAAARSSESTSS